MQKGFKIMALTLVLLAGAFMGDDVKSDRNGTNTPTLAELQSGERTNHGSPFQSPLPGAQTPAQERLALKT